MYEGNGNMKRTLAFGSLRGIGFALASSCDTGGTSGSGSPGDQSDAGGTIGGPQQEVFINEVVHAGFGTAAALAHGDDKAGTRILRAGI